jgi:hypothetical protein
MSITLRRPRFRLPVPEQNANALLSSGTGILYDRQDSSFRTRPLSVHRVLEQLGSFNPRLLLVSIQISIPSQPAFPLRPFSSICEHLQCPLLWHCFLLQTHSKGRLEDETTPSQVCFSITSSFSIAPNHAITLGLTRQPGPPITTLMSSRSARIPFFSPSMSMPPPLIHISRPVGPQRVGLVCRLALFTVFWRTTLRTHQRQKRFAN